MAATYPMVLKLAGRPVLVVGGGAVAARKVTGLRGAEAAVRVVSIAFVPELSERQDITRISGRYEPAHMVGAELVFACTDDRQVNAMVAADARHSGIWCCVASDAEEGDFHVPAVFRQGELTLAVSSSGASPLLAAAARDHLASHLGPEWGILAEEMARARRLLAERVPDAGARRQILEALCTECSVKLLTARDRAAWRAWLERMTEYRLKGLRETPDGL